MSVGKSHFCGENGYVQANYLKLHEKLARNASTGNLAKFQDSAPPPKSVTTQNVKYAWCVVSNFQ